MILGEVFAPASNEMRRFSEVGSVSLGGNEVSFLWVVVVVVDSALPLEVAARMCCRASPSASLADRAIASGTGNGRLLTPPPTPP